MPPPAPTPPPAATRPGDPDRIEAARRKAGASNAALDWMDLAFELFSGYRMEEGHEALARTLARDPGFLPARWLQFQMPRWPVPRSAGEAAQFASDWERGLGEFERLDPAAPGVKPHLWGCVGATTSFYRHYLGDDVTALQRRHGALLHRMMAQLDRGDAPRALRAGRRRVLFCSPYFHEHTVARLFVPLIERLDRARFDVHLLHFGAARDAMTARAQRAATYHGGPQPAPRWRQVISRLQADAIVYLDIGMDPITQALAALRLAPRQAMLWGHPVTTGLPTLDAVLSPDDMEPAAAQSHYTERLVRLPGMGHGLVIGTPAAPLAASGTDAPLADPAHAPARMIDLFCAQSVYKLLPAHDALFARILARLPDARLHLIPHPLAHVRDGLRERMRPAFAAAGVDVDARVELHATRPLAGFLDLASRCALNLDSIGWSGGMSSIDLLGLGPPTVTLPQASMRSRQTAALLQRLGVPELIASDEGDYVERAVALAGDAARRERLAARLREGLPGLDDAERVTRALEAFLAG